MDEDGEEDDGGDDEEELTGGVEGMRGGGLWKDKEEGGGEGKGRMEDEQIMAWDEDEDAGGGR